MKYSKAKVVTKGNLPTIYGDLLKLNKRYSGVECTNYYINRIKSEKILNKYGIYTDEILNSMTAVMYDVSIELELNFVTGSDFIRITNNGLGDNFKATLVNTDDKIIFDNNRLIVYGDYITGLRYKEIINFIK